MADMEINKDIAEFLPYTLTFIIFLGLPVTSVRASARPPRKPSGYSFSGRSAFNPKGLLKRPALPQQPEAKSPKLSSFEQSLHCLIDRHLPNTPQIQRLLQREGRAHVFNALETLKRVMQVIIADGERTGIEDEDDDYERYGLYFSEAIGYIVKIDGSQTPLYYGEIKIAKITGECHAIPRTSPRRTS